MTTSRAPLILAIVVLLLMLYAGSYLALAVPGGAEYVTDPEPPHLRLLHYRYGGDAAERIFWPLEQIDRRIRPKAWEWGWWK